MPKMRELTHQRQPSKATNDEESHLSHPGSESKGNSEASSRASPKQQTKTAATHRSNLLDITPFDIDSSFRNVSPPPLAAAVLNHLPNKLLLHSYPCLRICYQKALSPREPFRNTRHGECQMQAWEMCQKNGPYLQAVLYASVPREKRA